MKLFIAWSGTRGYQFAEALATFLRDVFPNEEVSYFFSAEIEPGTAWFPAVEKGLAEADAVLLCVTREGLHSPWIHFELGSRFGADQNSRVYTYLLGVKPGELSDPISRYQALDCTQEGTRRLVEGISKRPREELEKRFQAAWPQLERVIGRLMFYAINDLIPGFERLFLRKTFQEPMEECLDQTWLDRYYGARQTLEILQAELKSADEPWQPYQITILQELISEIDGYVREMRRYLVREVQFALKPDGQLDFENPADVLSNQPPGSAKWSQKRCERIRQLASELLDPRGAPVLAEAPYFMTLKPFWRKKDFVHRIETEIEQKSFTLKKYETELCQSSFWDFDRIAFYLTVEKDQERLFKTENLIQRVKMEIEKLEARDEEEISAMPLHYAIRAMSSVFQKAPERTSLIERVEACRQEVAALLEKNKKLDGGGQIRKRLDQLAASIKWTLGGH